MSVSNCIFAASTTTCDSAEGFARNTLFSVIYSALVIKDAAGELVISTIGSCLVSAWLDHRQIRLKAWHGHGLVIGG